MRHLGRKAILIVAVACASSIALAKPKRKAAAKVPKDDTALEAELDKLNKQWSDEFKNQDVDKLLAIEKKAYEIQVKLTGEDSREVLDRKGRLARASMDAAKYAQAEKLYLAIVAGLSKRKGASSRDVVEPLTNLSVIYMRQLRYDDVEKTNQRILAVTKKLDGETSVEYAQQLGWVGAGLLLRSEYSAAQRLLEEALAIVEKSSKATDVDRRVALQALGDLYFKSNQPAKGVSAWDQVIALVHKDASTSAFDKVAVLYQVGTIYILNGRKDLGTRLFDKAEERCKSEIARLEKAKSSDKQRAFELAVLYSALGFIYSYQHKELPKAEEAYGKAMKLYEKHGTTGYVEASLAEVKRAQGKPKEALALLDKMKNSGVDLMRVDVLRELGDYKRAAQAAESYMKIASRLTTSLSWSYIYPALRLAEVYALDKRLKDAEKTLTDALELDEKLLSNALQVGTDADHIAYFAQTGDTLDVALSFNTLFVKNGTGARLGMTALLRRKGRVLDAAASAMATIRGKLSAADKQLLDELNAARARLSKMSVSGGSAQDIAALEATIQKLEGQLARKSAAYRRAVQSIDLAAIQKLIPKDTRLVEFANFEPRDPRRTYAQMHAQPHLPRRYIAYVLGPSGDPVVVDLGEAAPIEQAIVAFHKAVSDPDNDQALDLGKALHDLTTAKIVPKLGGATNVLIAPDGALNVVPFSALVDDKKQFLIKKYTFTYLTTGRDLLRLTVKTKAAGGGVLFADPAFDATGGAKAKSRGRRSADLATLSWPQLPGTAAEADAIQKTYKGLKVHRGAAATEGTLKKVKGPTILHLATHGFFLPDEAPPAAAQGTAAAPAENPLLRSGLAFAGANKLSSGDDDGLLTALEASGLDLHGTKLVVLSACETGAGKVTNGDGVYGLRRSLVIAGAESLVMSLWQVDDFATKELMAGFYKKLAAGDGRSAALRETQLALLAKAKYAHPFFWAAFLPAGATTALKD